MKPLRPRKRAIHFLVFSLLFIVVIPFIIAYSLGYRFTKDYTLTERGGVYVFVTESGSNIYINDELKKTTGTFSKELFLQNLKPGPYLVRVSNEHFSEWTKNIFVKEKEVAPLYPFLVPTDLGLREIGVGTSTTISTATTTTYVSATEYKKITDLFKAPPLPVVQPSKIATTLVATTSPETFAVTKKKMKIWFAGGEVFAKWIGDEGRRPLYFCEEDICQSITIAFSAEIPITHVDFYPNRDDVIIVSVGDSIIATEIDTRPNKNSHVLFKGKKPDFRVSDNKVYVKDGSFIGQILYE